MSPLVSSKTDLADTLHILYDASYKEPNTSDQTNSTQMHQSNSEAEGQTVDIKNSLWDVTWLQEFTIFQFPNNQPPLPHRRTAFILELICHTVLQAVWSHSAWAEQRWQEKSCSVWKAPCWLRCVSTPQAESPASTRHSEPSTEEKWWTRAQTWGTSHTGVTCCSLPLQGEDWLPSPALPVLLQMDLP